MWQVVGTHGGVPVKAHGHVVGGGGAPDFLPLPRATERQHFPT
jgi:hypothetical protein